MSGIIGSINTRGSGLINTGSALDGRVLTGTGVGLPTGFEALSAGGGVIVQVVNVQTSSFASGSTVVPLDNTIPQSGEGTEFFTLAVTPTSASNKLIIRLDATMTVTSDAIALCIFQDSTASAIATSVEMGAAHAHPVSLQHYMTADTTSATTFKFRAGSTSATVYLNGSDSNAKHGGSMKSSMTIYEVAV